MRTATALIADDEPALRNFLHRELQTCWPELDVVGEAGNGTEAAEIIERLRPDVAFLDIRMPAMSGLEVAQRTGALCHLVFVTAHDEFAVEAFDNAAIDYLLKPVSRERLQRTVARVKERLASLPRDLTALIAQIQGPQAPAPSYLQWLQVSHGNEIFVVAAAEIDLFQSADKYTLAITPTKQWVIRKPIKDLENELDPTQFWRIHRNTIVRVAAIDRAAREFSGRLVLHLRGRSQACPISRAYAYRFKQL
jgi:DNA-binding LytR/AlgR family response regulator